MDWHACETSGLETRECYCQPASDACSREQSTNTAACYDYELEMAHSAHLEGRMLQAALRSHSSKLGIVSGHRPEGSRNLTNQRPSGINKPATGRGSRSYQSEARKTMDSVNISSTILTVGTTVHCNTLSLRMHKRPKA